MMKEITSDAFQKLCKDAAILVDTRHGPKVLETKDQHIIKIFRPRKRISSANFKPRALQFMKNAEALARLGMPSLNVNEARHCPEENLQFVTYAKEAGDEIRTIAERDPTILNELPAFMAMLHQKGIFFRGIHLGNVLKKPDGQFCLIDFVDLKVIGKPLNVWRRARNLKHLLHDHSDQTTFQHFGLDRFISEYTAVAGLNAFQRWMLRKLF